MSKRELRRLQKEIMERHLGIIAGCCLQYYRQLAPTVRYCYDAEDMIQEVALHVLRHAHSYDPARAQLNTFVHHAAANKCKTIRSHYRRKMRVAQHVYLDAVPIEGRPMELPAPDSTVALREARAAWECVIQNASSDLRAFLEGLFNSGGWITAPGRAVRNELEQLACQYGASPMQFSMLLQFMSV